MDHDDVARYVGSIGGEEFQHDAEYYDYNGNGEVDFADVVDLFKQV